jgi:hypothetical protein
MVKVKEGNIKAKTNYDSVNKKRNLSPNNFIYDYSNKNKFIVLHQNIRGLTNKIYEFLISLPFNAPQVICVTEHHLKTEEIDNANFEQYTLGSAFCRKTFKQRVVCIYISKNICLNAINLDQYTKEKDFGICALKLCMLTFWLRNLNGYSRPFAADIIFAKHLNFVTWFTKKFIIPGTKKDLIIY